MDVLALPGFLAQDASCNLIISILQPQALRTRLILRIIIILTAVCSYREIPCFVQELMRFTTHESRLVLIH